jgi:hypothetical protein
MLVYKPFRICKTVQMILPTTKLQHSMKNTVSRSTFVFLLKSGTPTISYKVAPQLDKLVITHMSLGFVEISIDRVISQLITSYNYRHHIVGLMVEISVDR